MTDKPSPEQVKEIVQRIINRGYEEIFTDLDRLHGRNIHDNEVLQALRDLGEDDMVDQYADWAEIDTRTDDNTTTNPTVTDSWKLGSYEALDAHLHAVTTARKGVTDHDLELFNRRWPLGAKVRYWPGAKTGEGRVSTISTPVFVVGGVPVVTVKDYPGGIALTHIERLPADD